MKDFWLKVGAVVLAIISPFIMVSTGVEPSISSYWMTDWQPLFIVTNAITSYYMFSVKNWKLSALFLLMLTAFSVESFPNLHNYMAIAFFLANLRPLYKIKRYRFLLGIYITLSPIFFFSILWGEIASILVLALHHGLTLFEYVRINKQRQSLKANHI